MRAPAQTEAEVILRTTPLFFLQAASGGRVGEVSTDPTAVLGGGDSQIVGIRQRRVGGQGNADWIRLF